MPKTDNPDRLATVDYASTGPRQFELLQTMPLEEAELARVKLESEGIRCFIAGQHVATMNSLLFHDVQLMVDPSDLEEAREVLDSPADEAMEGEYVEEAWRCPKCHRKGLELLPAAGLRKRAWTFWWVLAALVAAEIVMGWMSSADAYSTQGWNATADRALLPTLLAIGGVTIYLMIGHREKRCPRCGWCSQERVPLRGDR